MRRLMPLLAAAALLLSTAAARADLGDQVFKLLPDDGAEEDFFGQSVAISGTIAIVGTNRDDDNGPNSGSAYLFDATTGQQTAKLLPIDGVAGERFGYSVAISGETIIVGAYRGIHPKGYASGSAYLHDSTTGQQLHKFLANDGEHTDYFGYSVAISNTAAIVGAWGDDDNGDTSGSAYLFDITTGRQIAKLLPDDGATSAGFGWAVGISGTTAIVGTRPAGAAYLFDITTGQQIAKLLPEDGLQGDYFGRAVAISGPTSIVGSHLDDDNGEASGSAYLFDAGGASPCPEDFDGDGTVGASDLAVLLGYWGLNPGHPADLDADGSIGAADLAILLDNWGPCPEIVCLDPKMDPTDLNCQGSAECNIDGAIIVYDLFECYCLEGVAEEQCCDAILQSFEESCASSGGVLEGSFCNCFP